MGVIAGVPDLHLPVPKGIYAGLYIELKYNKGRLESSQREFLKLAARYGNYCAVCYGAEEAIRVINEYIGLKIIDTGKTWFCAFKFKKCEMLYRIKIIVYDQKKQ